MRGLFQRKGHGSILNAVYWTVTGGVRFGVFDKEYPPRLEDLELVSIDDWDEFIEWLDRFQQGLKTDGYRSVDFPKDLVSKIGDGLEASVASVLTLSLPEIESDTLEHAAKAMQSAAHSLAACDIDVTLPSQDAFVLRRSVAPDEFETIFEIASDAGAATPSIGHSRYRRVVGGKTVTIKTAGKVEDLLFRILAAVIHQRQGGVAIIDGPNKLTNPQFISLQNTQAKSAWWVSREAVRDVLQTYGLLSVRDRSLMHHRTVKAGRINLAF